MDADAEHDPPVDALRCLLEFCLPVWCILALGLGAWLLLLPATALIALCGRRLPAPVPPAGPPIAMEERRPSGAKPPRDTVLLVHGFPDCPAMWDAVVEALVADGYRCLNAALPGANGEPVPHPWPLHAIAEALYGALQQHERGPVTLVLHDWGSLYGFLIAQRHPASVRRVVSLDIGGHLPRGPPVATLAALSYQGTLAVVYLLGGPVGQRMLQLLARVFRYSARPLQALTPAMAHHYVSLFRLLAGLDRAPAGPRGVDWRPEVPVLFAYGRAKLFMFHSREWVRRVRAAPQGRVVAFPCGHWLTVDRGPEVVALLREWLDETEAAAGLKAG